MGARWYAVALLTAPLSYMGVSLALSLTSPEYLPGILATSDKAFLLLFGIGWGLIGGGLLEELGWTGFAVPTLLRRMRYGVLSYRAHRRGALGSVSLPCERLGRRHFLRSALRWPSSLPLELFFFTVAGLTAYRVLMVWVYERSWEPALGDTHARESHSQHVYPLLLWRYQGWPS